MRNISVKTFSLLGVALLLLAISQQAQPVDSANILGVFTSNSPSHLIVHMSVVKALAEQGHNVTVVSAMKPTVTHAGIHHIIIPPAEEDTTTLNRLMKDMAGKKSTIITTLINMLGSKSILTDLQLKLVQDKRFTALYENPDTKFDVMILGYFLNDFQLAIAAKFKCPFIVSWMGNPMSMVNDFVGNPTEAAYVPNLSVGVKAGEIMNFFQRIRNFISEMFLQLFQIILNSRFEKYYNKLTSGDKLPTYADMKKNASLVFCNSAAISEGPIRPNVPALVEIGGIQIKDKPDALPKDIADFLEASKKKGAILFSLGSNLQGSHINPDTVNIIFKTLSSLKQNVIWKWDDMDKTPGKSPNILYKKWLPQDDILAHPSIKLFITHAGKGGLTEASYHGVPMVALPVFGDQHENAEKMRATGYGLRLDLLQLTESVLKDAISEVLNNPTYSNNIKKFSRLYRDRPMTAKQNVVFWTEYVIRHHGAAHLQSPLVHMNAIQSSNLDVVVFLCLLVYAAWRLLKFVGKFVYRKLCKKCKAEEKPKPKQKVKKH